MKIYFFLLIVFFSTQGWGASITMVKDSDIFSGNNPNRPNKTYFVQPASAPSGSTSTDSAISVYIPIFNSGIYSTGTTNGDFSVFTYLDETLKPVYTIPSIGDSLSGQSYVRHYLNIDAPVNSYLYAGLVKTNDSNEKEVWILSNKGDNSSYYISFLGNLNTTNYLVNFYLINLCMDSYVATYNPCLNLEFDSNIPTSLTNKIYYFASIENDYNPSTPVLLKDVPNGIYFDYILSNIAPVSLPTISTVAKGDERIKINYTGNGIQNIKDVIGVKYEHEPSTPTGYPNYLQVLEDGGVLASDDNGTSPSGSVVIKGLQNSDPVWVRVAYLNKWGFASYFSNTGSQTPEKIQTFLQEKQCYLLSAGFQKEHYILEYFRSFRDNILLKNSLGRSFVQWYYDTAPFYAKYVYHNAVLRNVIKALAYISYFILRFFPVILLIVFIPLVIFAIRRFILINK